MGKTGGIGVFLKQFTNQLKQHDFKITVFSFGCKRTHFDDNGVKVIKIKDLSAFNAWLRAPLLRYKIPGYITFKLFLEFINRLYISLYLSVFVLRHRFDLIEFHDYGGDAPYFMSRLPKVVRCHGSALTLHQYMGYANRISDSVFEKQFFKRFHTHVVAVSQYSAQITQEAFHLKNRPHVIYNGVNLLKLEQKPSYLDAPTLAFSIFYFGSVRERKGIDIACKVFNEVLSVFPEATFHVMGNNNNDYWNIHALKLLSADAQAHTTYYGTVPNEQVNDYLKKAHVVVFPSYGENFSVALLEAMAIGKIVVTSAIPSFKEIMVHGENGFIAETFEDYVDVITKIFNKNINLKSVSNQALLTLKSRFEMEAIIQENIKYYKTLLSFEI